MIVQVIATSRGIVPPLIPSIAEVLAVLSRYTIYRRRPQDAPPLPAGIRQDTRWRTRHVLRPEQVMVESLLADPSDAGWRAFTELYLALLAGRLEENSEAFEKLARLASENDVFLGCSCPTKKNPDVRHCHTWLALGFMKRNFPSLEVVFPKHHVHSPMP